MTNNEKSKEIHFEPIDVVSKYDILIKMDTTKIAPGYKIHVLDRNSVFVFNDGRWELDIREQTEGGSGTGSIFTLQITESLTRSVLVKAIDSETAKTKLLSAYNTGKISLDSSNSTLGIFVKDISDIQLISGGNFDKLWTLV